MYNNSIGRASGLWQQGAEAYIINAWDDLIVRGILIYSKGDAFDAKVSQPGGGNVSLILEGLVSMKKTIKPSTKEVITPLPAILTLREHPVDHEPSANAAQLMIGPARQCADVRALVDQEACICF